MKFRWIHLYAVIIILSVSNFSTAEFVETEVLNEKKCNSDMSQYHIRTSYGLKTTCAYVSPDRQTWNEAKFRCNLLFSQLTQQIHYESSLHKDLLNRSIDILWMGIHRQNNFFVTEYPSKLFREADAFSSGYWGYHWSNGEPGLDDCVAVNISSGSLQTRNCNDLLPFVCDDDWENVNIIYEDSACPEKWNLSFALSSSGRTCVLPQKPHTYQDAEEICAQNDGRLATFAEYNILSDTKFFSTMFSEKFWMKRRNPDVCEIRIINNYLIGSSETSPEICEHKYPFICVKHYEEMNIRVSVYPKAMKNMQHDSKNGVDMLTCFMENEFPERNNEIDLWIQWYKDGLPLSFNSDVLMLSFIGDALKRDQDTLDVASRQGYYRCEVQNPGSNEKYTSPKMKYFYTDIATYVVEIRGIKVTNDLDYSHERFFDYMDDFDEASMSNVLEKVKAQYPKTEWDFMSKSISDKETIMKIVIYIYKTDIKDFDERIACEELEEAFNDLNSVPVFMENMSVKMNCEEFPITNSNLQIIKNLKIIETKINNIENRQEYILQKLEDCGRSRIVEPTRDSPDFDPEFFSDVIEDLKDIGNNLRKHHKSPDVKIRRFLKAVQDLKNTGKSLLHETPDFKNLDGKEKHRERNELEERNENYIQYSGKDLEEIVSSKNALYKDL